MFNRIIYSIFKMYKKFYFRARTKCTKHMFDLLIFETHIATVFWNAR